MPIGFSCLRKVMTRNDYSFLPQATTKDRLQWNSLRHCFGMSELVPCFCEHDTRIGFGSETFASDTPTIERN